jgi:hypothetical protein
MSRKNIFDTLKDKYDIEAELQRINYLFSGVCAFKSYSYSYREFTFEQMVNNKYIS